jgi:hypothetical protein
MILLRFPTQPIKGIKRKGIALSLSKDRKGMSFKNLRVLCVKAFALLATLLMSSCADLDSFLATPTLIIPTETPRPTATTVWFPPSITPSPQFLSTRAPTPEMRPGIGEILFSDDFSRSLLWDIAASDQASASINKHRLNLAAESEIYMLSLRHETILNDYYVEITAAPNLCRDKDSYGVLIRANAIAYYRFGLSCNGAVGAERISGNSREALQKPLPSGDVPPGAGEVRIGVWAVGADMRLFLNGRYQFSVNNAHYLTGTIGVFVNSAGNTPVVVSFSDLIVREIR